jgi:hypothetical protein
MLVAQESWTMKLFPPLYFVALFAVDHEHSKYCELSEVAELDGRYRIAPRRDCAGRIYCRRLCPSLRGRERIV